MPKRAVRHAVEQPQDQTIRLIPLTQGLNAIVSVEDYEDLSRHHWMALKHPFRISAVRDIWEHSVRIGREYMSHRVIAPPVGRIIDHINGDTLDNRRSNLRIATASQNAINKKLQINNTSGQRGVSWSKTLCKWVVLIQIEEDYKTGNNKLD